jgi:hypothetical protein
VDEEDYRWERTQFGVILPQVIEFGSWVSKWFFLGKEMRKSLKAKPGYQPLNFWPLADN